MRRVGRALYAAACLLAAASALVACSPAPAADPPDPPQVSLHILAVGDSIEVGPGDGGWRSRLGALAASVGVQLQIDPYAVGQWRADDALPGFAAALLRQPDIVLLTLGTNDGTDPGFEGRYNRLIKYALDITNAQVFTSWVTYSAPACVGCAAAQAAANDAIYRQMLAYGYFASPRPARHPGWADMQDIPPSYLDAGGVHPRPADPDGYLVMAHKWWDVIAAARGLPPIPWTPPIPLTGHRP